MPVPVPTSVNQVADNRASVMASAPKVIPLERDLHSKAQGFLAGRKKQRGGATFDEVFGNIASSAFNPYSGKISMNIGGMPGITPIVPKQVNSNIYNVFLKALNFIALKLNSRNSMDSQLFSIDQIYISVFFL